LGFTRKTARGAFDRRRGGAEFGSFCAVAVTRKLCGFVTVAETIEQLRRKRCGIVIGLSKKQEFLILH
jgi:hypothetical protein